MATLYGCGNNGITVTGGDGKVYESYQECCAANDYEAAHLFLAKIQNSELWDLDYTIIKFILPRLKKFKEINIISYPTKCGNIENWHKIIDKMIWSFQFALDVAEMNYSNEYRLN